MTKSHQPTSRDDSMVYDGLDRVSEILDQLSCTSILLVADPVAYEQSGASHSLEQVLESRKVEIFSEFTPNPSLEALVDGIRHYHSVQPDAIVAVGGGTAIDLAKLIGFCAMQAVDPADLIKNPLSNPRKGVPVIVVPTTAGTGSEATHFAVVYLEGRKYSVAHSYLLPDFAILDSTLTNTMPPNITANTGLDALCQAIESMWSVHSTVESIAYATESIQLAWRHLEPAVQHPTEEDRQAMCQAAHLAGKAINISKTTAPHAISYTITSQFGVVHGSAVALTLGAVLAFNDEVSDSDCSDDRGADYVRRIVDDIVHLLGFETSQSAVHGFRDLLTALDCPTRLSEVGATTDEQIEDIASRVNVDRLSNNPRRFTPESLLMILHLIR
ncbi:MAG: phosphonoacetaldehyde reductase [Candidatus Hydrogenedentota bacterium]